MSRPKRYAEPRVTTAIRLPPDIHAALMKAAGEREISANRIVSMALADYLPRMVPVEELRWAHLVRPAEEPDQ